MTYSNPTNESRAAKAIQALSGYDHGDDLHTNIVDLLSDLRHLCGLHGLDFGNLDRVAYQHYCAEIHNVRT